MGECRWNEGDTGEIAGALVRGLEVVRSETAVGRVGSEMIAPVFGMVAGFLGLLAAVLL
jgi:hypothetical protein